MSKIYQLPNSEQHFDDASVWLAKLDRGLSTKEQQDLQRWMAKHPENQRILFKMAKLWDKMDALSRLTYLFPESVYQKKRLPKYFLAAASIFIALFIGIMSELPPKSLLLFNENVVVSKVTDNEYETEVGEHSMVTLTDGSELILNTNTLVQVHYTATHRLLTLQRGEMHVRVAKDEDRPLSVLAGNSIVQAVGTEFNVEISDTQKIELVVTEGKVLIGVRNK